MPAVHAEYAYRHATKAPRISVRPKARQGVVARLRTHRRPGQTGLGQRDEEERRRTLLKLAKAERGLHLLERTTLREYTTHTGNVAIRANELGIKNIGRGNLVRAFRNFREAIDRDPNFDLAHNNIGLLYLEIGDHERAEWHFNNAVENIFFLLAQLSRELQAGLFHTGMGTRNPAGNPD